MPTGAAGLNQLQRVKGTVGYQPPNGAFQPVFGRYDLQTTDSAITQAASAAVIALPDSSLISLGENTNVNVGDLQTAADGSVGPTVALNGGALRFDVRRPAGSRANYHFVTTTSQLAIRGTVGLLSYVPGGDTTVVCLACEADSVVVTVGTQTYGLKTGQTLVITAAGLVTAGAITAAILASFASASVPTASAATAAAAGASAAAGATAATTTAVAAGAVAAAAVGVTVANSIKASPSPSPTPMQGGTGNLTSVIRAHPVPSAMPVPTPAPTPAGLPRLVAPAGRVR